MVSHTSIEGFTLIEIMVVIVILVVTISVIFPVSHTMVDKFDRYIAKYQASQDFKQEKFKKFIVDRIH